ncbi:hypothetical protein RJ55_05731 [Drechmeria coniospora]|nr:hypothetical protein RJ55_05731 [Drechmeria coniospora]
MATRRILQPLSRFYKTFTRPVAKALLLAVFSYQVVYWSWMKLEADEYRAETDATIMKLEANVATYDNGAKSKPVGEDTSVKGQ